MAIHGTNVYYTLDALLEHMLHTQEECLEDPNRVNWNIKYKRYWIRKWKQHQLRHPGEPMVHRCSLCSGKEQKIEIKLGKFKVSTRQDQKILKEQMEESED